MSAISYIWVFLSFAFVSGAFGQEKQEPVCSRFHYEEMLLEKMVRLEHSTNLMMAEFREIKTKVDNNLATFKQATEDMKSKLEKELESLRNASERAAKPATELQVIREEMKQNVKQATDEMRAKVQEEMQTNREATITGKACEGHE